MHDIFLIRECLLKFMKFCGYHGYLINLGIYFEIQNYFLVTLGLVGRPMGVSFLCGSNGQCHHGFFSYTAK